MNIYIFGSMAYDRIMDFPGRFSDHILPDKLHILNVCFTVNGMKEKFGGTAGNIAYSLRLLGEKPIIISTIGKDHQPYFQWLKKNGITTEAIKVIKNEFTAGAYITTDLSDNQITGFNPGAMKHSSGNKLAKASAGSIMLIAPGNLKDMADYARLCKKKRIPYICDPGQSLTGWKGKDLTDWIRGAFMLISNDYELELIMKITGCDKKSLLHMTPNIITTLGEKGALVSTAHGTTPVPAAKIQKVSDPTGAGDAFRAGLLKGIVTGSDMVTAARMGAVSAVYAVEQYGTQEHKYTRTEFKKRYSNNFGKL